MKQVILAQDETIHKRIAGLDPKGDYLAWLSKHLIADKESSMDPIDIQQAFDIAFGPAKTNPSGARLDATQIAILVWSLYSDINFNEGDGKAPYPRLEGVRWLELEVSCLKCGAERCSDNEMLSSQKHRQSPAHKSC